MTGATYNLSHRQILVVFSGLMLGMMLAGLDATIVATALPTITGELGGLNHLSWVVTAYLLAWTVSTPLYGKLGDLFGRKKLFQIAISVFMAGSVLGGVAQNMNMLILGRAVQGLGGGGLIVLGQAIIADVVSPRQRGRYQGYFGAFFGATSVAGPLLGGFFTDHLSWRWVFYINIPLGVVALFVTSAVLPAGSRRGNPRIDYAGTVLLTGAVTCLVLFTTWGGNEHEWGSATIIGLAVAAVALLVALLVVERRATEPMLPIHLFSMRTFSLSSAVMFIVGVGMFGCIAFLPLFQQVVNGASATNSGLLLMPFMLGLVAASVISGRLISRTGRYKVFPLLGTALAAGAMFLLGVMDEHTSRTTVTFYMIMMGLGIGQTLQTLILATQNDVPAADLGAATSTVTFFRSLGGSVGVALFGAIFNSGLSSRLAGLNIEVGEGKTFNADTIRGLTGPSRAQAISGFADALTRVFLFAGPLVLLSVALVLFMRENPLRETTHVDSRTDALAADMEVAPLVH